MSLPPPPEAEVDPPERGFLFSEVDPYVTGARFARFSRNERVRCRLCVWQQYRPSGTGEKEARRLYLQHYVEIHADE